MRVLVCGGRDYRNEDHVWYMLDKINAEYEFRMIVEGAASGADTLAYNWAMSRRIPCLRVPAEWDKWGKKAGYERNKKMLEMVKPDRIIAFPGGVGTQMMLDLGAQTGVRSIQIGPSPPQDMPDGFASNGLVLRRGPDKEGGIMTWYVAPLRSSTALR